MYDVEDTIVGVASAAGGGIRGILRLSGPTVLARLADAFRDEEGSPLRADFTSARVVQASLVLPPPIRSVNGDLYIWPTARSYTRQPAAEFHTIGAPPILEAATKHLCSIGSSVRLAEPGEFTLRAFMAGRLDLTQAEAVLGVIDASDAGQLGTALSQLAGGLATPLGQLRDQLLDLLAHLEAGLDFVEEDIEFITVDALVAQLGRAADRLAEIADQLNRRSTGDEVAKVVLVGDANVGKSSLFNTITGSSDALVSNVAGTTRDYLTERVDLGGIAVDFVDTAGRHETALRDEIGDASQGLAKQQSSAALVRIVCVDAAGGSVTDAPAVEEREIIVLTKSDLADPRQAKPENAIATSSVDGSGISELKQAVRERLIAAVKGSNLAVTSTTARCHQSLSRAEQSLATALQLAREAAGDELVAHELRIVLDEIGKMVGAVYTDDILDRVFSRFCIGK